jgi:hypothetical protein
MLVVVPAPRSIEASPDAACELVVDFGGNSWCPNSGCPPFAGCVKTLHVEPVTGELLVVCRCGSSGPVPYCCYLAQVRSTGQAVARGLCTATPCPPGDCQVFPDVESGVYYALCD